MATSTRDDKFGNILKALIALNVTEEGSVISAAPGASSASSGCGVESKVFAVEGCIG